jgi:hypothetical protein
MVRRKATARVQVPVRMMETLRARLAKAAKTGGISLNAEIVRRLEQSFDQELAADILGQAKEVLGKAAELYGQTVPPERRLTPLAERVAEIEKQRGK